EKDLHQEEEGMEQLAFMLKEKGLLPGGKMGFTIAQEKLPVLNLRFEPGKSPVEAIPVNLREPLFRIFLQHSQGSVRKQGEKWINFDPLREPELKKPYKFEKKDKTISK